jgi:hypothetical protein
MSAALTFGLLVPFALIVLVLLVVVVLVDRRDDLDPEGRRPFAAYVFVVVFLTLFTTLFALAAMVGSLVHIAIGDGGSRQSRGATTTQTFTVNGSTVSGESGGDGVTSSNSTESSSDADDAHIRDAVRAGLLAAAAGGVLFFHLGMARRAAEDPALGAGQARRIYHAYLYAAATLAVIIVVGAATAFGYGIFKVIAPGVASPSGVGERKNALPDLAASGVLVAGAVFIFLYHFRRRPNGGGAAIAALPPAPDAFAPPPEPEPEPEPEPPPPAPAKRPARKAPAAKKTPTRRASRAE